jgi:hypothetical protein
MKKPDRKKQTEVPGETESSSVKEIIANAKPSSVTEAVDKTTGEAESSPVREVPANAKPSSVTETADKTTGEMGSSSVREVPANTKPSQVTETVDKTIGKQRSSPVKEIIIEDQDSSNRPITRGDKLYHFKFGPLEVIDIQNRADSINDRYVHCKILDIGGLIGGLKGTHKTERVFWESSIGHWLFRDPRHIGSENDNFPMPPHSGKVSSNGFDYKQMHSFY